MVFRTKELVKNVKAVIYFPEKDYLPLEGNCSLFHNSARYTERVAQFNMLPCLF